MSDTTYTAIIYTLTLVVIFAVGILYGWLITRQ